MHQRNAEVAADGVGDQLRYADALHGSGWGGVALVNGEGGGGCFFVLFLIVYYSSVFLNNSRRESGRCSVSMYSL
jgi:hypothetical protein